MSGLRKQQEKVPHLFFRKDSQMWLLEGPERSRPVEGLSCQITSKITRSSTRGKVEVNIILSALPLLHIDDILTTPARTLATLLPIHCINPSHQLLLNSLFRNIPHVDCQAFEGYSPCML